MINTIYERNINKATSVVIEECYNKFEVCMIDYSAICKKRARLYDGIFPAEHVPLFTTASDAIAFVDSNIDNLI